jgi:hypothetical protein
MSETEDSLRDISSNRRETALPMAEDDDLQSAICNLQSASRDQLIRSCQNRGKSEVRRRSSLSGFCEDLEETRSRIDPRLCEARPLGSDPRVRQSVRRPRASASN